MFFISFASAMFAALAINEIKKEGLNKKKSIIHFSLFNMNYLLSLCYMLKDNIITAKEYLSIAANIFKINEV